MRYVCLYSLIATLLSTPLAWSQDPTAPPPPSRLTCEQQVEEQYRQLSTDNLVPQATAPQWSPQLIAIVTQLRVRSNQYELKKNQAEFAEQNWLRTLADQRMRGPASPAPPAN